VTTSEKVGLTITSIVMAVIAGGSLLYFNWQTHRLRSLQGAVLVQDSDVRKQRPISGVQVMATIGRITVTATSSASGLFVIDVGPGTRRGEAMSLEFRHPDYHPLTLQQYVGDQLYVVHMTPRAASPPIDDHRPAVRIGNVTIRYSVKTPTEVNIGSMVKTFQVENLGNVPCKKQRPCSPDGRWKAALGSTSLDAGTGNEFRDIRVSCIAGPCPFTRIEPERPSGGGQAVSVSARDWSDTATFLVEAEVRHQAMTQMAHEFYPVIFGKQLSFTLPAAVEGVTIEADVDDQNVFFPLGPSLLLSWANCTVSGNPEGTRLYRCELKPGHRFQ
jgi:hypothetical protein